MGTLLRNAISDAAKASGARMSVLETQSCNENAIAVYRKNGFEIIGFDLYSCSNTEPERHEIRIEMGKIQKCCRLRFVFETKCLLKAFVRQAAGDEKFSRRQLAL